MAATARAALNAALRLAADVMLVGVVYVPPDESLSTGAYQARQVRRWLRELSAGPQVRYKAASAGLASPVG